MQAVSRISFFLILGWQRALNSYAQLTLCPQKECAIPRVAFSYVLSSGATLGRGEYAA
jgi:hypothetical protein